MITTGRAQLDFGTSGVTDASIAVTGQSGITSDCVVHAWIERRATDDHSADEHSLEPIKVTAGDIVAGTGFTVYGVTGDTAPRYGKWTIGWSWGPRL